MTKLNLHSSTKLMYIMKGSLKELNILIYFFHLSLSGVLFPMFCLLVEGECQTLVFYNIIN